MRLICPNCDAQYEVEATAIPDGGRDVQCSNCGHAWFQLPPDLEAEQEAEEALFGKAAPVQVPQPVSTRSVETARGGDRGQSKVWADDPDDSAAAEVTAPPPPRPAAPPMPKPVPTPTPTAAPEVPVAKTAQAPATPAAETTTPPAASDVQSPVAGAWPGAAPRRGLDESLLAVLREEAEREAAVRRSQTPPRPLESQTELGLEETTGAASAAKAVRDRLARLRGQEAEPETTEKPTARRDLLPDIEEINSTLRASTENRSGDELAMEQASTTQAESRAGFRNGFSLMLLLAVVLVAAYLAAPKIATQFPASKGAMESYVSAVDKGRMMLDSAMRSAITALQNLTGGETS